MTEQGRQEIGEIQPRSKVLFINMSPTSDGPSFKLAMRTFTAPGQNVEDFPEMMISSIKSPEGTSGSIDQSSGSELDLPSVDEVSSVIITGSPFTAALLKRDLTRVGINEEGKAVLLPLWQKKLAKFIKEADEAGKPMLGICFGAEMIAESLGGKVGQLSKDEKGNKRREVGFSRVYRKGHFEDPVLNNLPSEFVTVANHDYEILRVPEGAEVLAENEFGVQVYRKGVVYGIQFHPEKTVEDAHKLIDKPTNRGKVDLELQKVLEKEFSPELMNSIFENFMRIAWHDLQ